MACGALYTGHSPRAVVIINMRWSAGQGRARSCWSSRVRDVCAALLSQHQLPVSRHLLSRHVLARPSDNRSIRDASFTWHLKICWPYKHQICGRKMRRYIFYEANIGKQEYLMPSAMTSSSSTCKSSAIFWSQWILLQIEKHRILKLPSKMPIYPEKNMWYAHFAKICEKCGNMQYMWQSHIRVKLASLIYSTHHWVE